MAIYLMNDDLGSIHCTSVQLEIERVENTDQAKNKTYD